MLKSRIVLAGFVGLSGLGLGGCEELFQVTIDVPEICQDIGAIGVSGLPGMPLSEMSQTVAVDLRGPLKNAGIDLDESGAVELSSISLWPMDGITDFGFARKAEVVIEGGSTLPPVTLLSLAQPEGAPASRIVATFADRPVDVLPYVVAGAVRLTTSFTGDAPDEPWTLGGEVCARVKGRYSLFAGVK